MKKLLSALLALCMLLALCACGAETEGAAEPAAAPAEAAAETISEAVEPLNILISTAMPEVTVYSQNIKFFADYVTEATDGAITFDIHYGGTFAAMPEEFDNLINGVMDMGNILIGFFNDKIPQFALPMYGNSPEDAMELCKELVFENEKTAPIFREVEETYGFKMLGFSCGGRSGYVSRQPFTTIAELSNVVFGCSRSFEFYEAVGLKPNLIDSSEGYEALRLGNVDAITSSLEGLITNGYYEVTEHALISQQNTVSNILCVRTEIWDQLTSEQKAIFEEAAEAMMQNNIEIVKASEEGYIAKISEANVVNYMTEEDDALLYTTELEMTYESVLPAAENLGVAEQWKILNETLAEVTNLPINEVSFE